MKANLATSLIAYARGGVRKQLLVLCLLTLCIGNTWASAYLKGAWDSWVNHDISGGSCEITLDANTEYEFGIDVDGSFYSYTNQNFTTTSTSFQIYTGNGNCKITTGEAGTYIFKTWYDNGRYMAVYYPQARLTKQKYIYFDARNQTNWNSDNFDARFWFKYYDSGSDNGSVDCNKGNALENWVYYALVPDHDYIGQIQMNRLNPSNHDEVWCTANIAYAKDRTSSAQNCLKEESGKANYCIYWTPQWTTYCPPMSSVTMADNGTTNWGGDGSSATPYLVPTGGDIKVHVTASASALDDANMTKYFLFKKEGSAVGEGSSSTEKTITASGTTGTKEAVTVDAYNYYNSTEGTHLTSSAIYYEARTPYTISYDAGTGGSGSLASETKLKGVNFTLPDSAVFERTGYTQTGWTTSNLGAQTHAFGASYSSDEAQTFYPAWTANEYTITLNNLEATTPGTESVTATYDATLSAITKPTKTHYDFGGYWTSSDDGSTLTTQLIDENGNWKKSISSYTGASGDDPTWVYADNITLYAKWTARNYIVTLEGMEADSEDSISVKVTYDAVLPSLETKHTKAHYDFGGYYTGYDNVNKVVTGSKLIEANGDWISDVEGYTGNDGEGNPTWIHDFNISLFAKWTEHPYKINLVVSPEGAGTIDKGDTIEAYYVTASDEITATASTGYSFREWDFSKQGESDYDVWCAAGYTPTKATIRISAKRDGTLTAKFTANNYNVNLENLDADEGYKGTENVSVTYNSSANLTENITIPQKAHYDFGGYYTGYDNVNKVVTGSKLIEANGNWIPDVEGYTGNDGEGHPTWIRDGINITLFADWTEHPYTVTTSVSPAGAGTLSCGSSVTAKWVTPSELITATANPAWKFVRWEYGTNVGPADGTGLNNTVQIKAAVDGTLTAVFEPRFCLVGAKRDNSGNGGMPGWHDYDHTADFNINSYTDLSNMNLTCVRSLDPNTTYKFEVHDKVKGQNLGYYGEDTYIADQSLLFNTQNNDVLLRVNGYGECTFTISALSDGDLYPTVSVAIPASHQLNLEWADVDIDNNWDKTSRGTGGSVSALTTESGHNFAIHNGEYVANGGDITYTATPDTGYTFEGWYSNDYKTRFSTTNPYTSSNIQTTENVEAKFVEKATAVTLSNDGHGHVEINDETVSSTTVGVTTHRELTAVPNEGYKFDSWTIVSGNDIALSSTSTNPTTLSGLGAGAVSGQEVRANFIERWIVQPEEGEWGYAHFTIEHIEEVGGKTIGYVDITLEANTNYQFSVVDRDGDVKYMNGSDQVYYMTNGNSHNWGFAKDKSCYCGITTAGAGVYRFTWNITDKKMTVTYPNFIIYRTGDKADDPRAQNTDVESYDGGTISQAIEFRMRVNRLDKWYTLCLPFKVNAVKVWDEEDGQYYDIVPYYRTSEKYYTGHYIIRTPVDTIDFAIENFDSRDRWVDPPIADGYLPSKNIPYIIQWHGDYFLDKYISFFGATGQTIPTSMNQGANTSSDETVNIYGNNCMTSGTVCDAYMLDSDYGSGGAWLRAEVGTDRTVLPFECFIRANATTTAKYRVLRRDMADDTPTGLDNLSMTEDSVSKVMINNRIYIIRGGKMYTIQGTFVKEVE